MADTKRRRTVAVSFAEDGSMLLRFYNTLDASGAQTVAETVPVTIDAINPALRDNFALNGFSNRFSNVYNRLDNPSADDLRREFDKFAATVADGSWTPGRAAGEDEPDDLILALAEVTGVAVATIQDKVDAMLDEPKRGPDGSILYDKRTPPRSVHVWTKAKLYNALENSDPRVKQSLSKIVAERAKRLAAEARTAPKSGTTSLADLFGSPAPTAAAAQ